MDTQDESKPEKRDDDSTRFCVGVGPGDHISLMDGLIEIEIKVASSRKRLTLCFVAPRIVPIRRRKKEKPA
jgi:hypothetical protein